MENEPIKLDGAPFEKAMQPVLNSLKEFRALVIALDQSPTGRLNAEMQKLKTGVVGFAGDLEKSLSTLPQMMAKQVAEASRQVNKQMRQAGKESADGFVDGSIQTVRARRQELQAQYESLAAMGKIKLPVLQQAQAAGVRFFPEDAARLKQASGSDSSNVLATQRRFTNALEADGKQYDVLLKARKQLQAEEVSNLNKLASGVEAANARLIANLVKTAETRRALAATASTELLTVLGMTGRAQVTGAMQNPAGQFSISRGVNTGRVVDAAADSAAAAASASAARTAAGAKADLTEKTKQAAAETLRLREEQKALAHSLGATHSAARGLASGFNAMFLTWGQIGPLLAGAAISNGFMQAVRAGSQFEQNLAAIQFLGGQTEIAVKGIGAAALDLARTGPVGPVELSAAFKALSLAGLSAKEQLEAIKPVLNFSIAGELEIGKAAESLTAISTAFGYTASGFDAVADVVAKAAAISMSSVADMTEAFRQASTVAQQFGVSTKDAATTLVFLSQVGIKGSAAGTAMRNMYNELMGASKQAQKILRDTLKIEVIDNATKAMKPLVTIMGDLSTALGKLDFKSQMEVLAKLGNERGLKAISADLIAFSQKAKDAGKDATTEFARIQQALEDAPGFAAAAAVGMSLTAQNQMKSVAATLQSSLVEAFQAMQPEILAVSRMLREAFASPEFREGISGLIGAIASGTRFLVEHLDVLKAVALGYLAGKIALVALSAGTALAASTTGLLGGAMAIAGVSSVTAAAGVRLFTIALGPIAILLTAAAAAYLYFSDTTKTATDKATQAVNDHVSATIEGFNKESERLEAQMALRKQGLDAQLRSQALEAALAQTRLDNLFNEERAAKLTARALLETARARIAGPDYSNTEQSVLNTAAVGNIDAQIAGIDTELANSAKAEFKKREVFSAAYQRMKDLSKKNAIEAEEEARKSRKPRTGAGTYDDSKGQGNSAAGNAKSAYDVLKQQLDNTLKAIDQQAKAEDSAAKLREAALKSSYSLGITNFTQYQTALDEAQANHTDARLKSALQAQAAANTFFEESTKRAAAANALQVAGKKLPIGGEKLLADQESARLKAKVEEDKVGELRNQQAVQQLAVEEKLAEQMVRASRAALDKVDNSKIELGLLQQQYEEAAKLGQLAGRDLLVAQAEAREREAFLKDERDLEREILQYRTAINTAKSRVRADGTVDPNDAARDAQRLAALEAASNNLKALRAQAGVGIAAKGAQAGMLDDNAALNKILDPQRAQNFGLALRGAFGEAKPELVSLLESMDDLGQSMTGVFGAAGDALGKLVGAVQKFGAAQGQVDLARSAANAIPDAAAKARALAKVDSAELKVKIGAYGDMASAAQGFFKEGSAGYKTMGGVSKAFHVAEIAMQIASIMPKLAAGAATMFGQSGWGGFAGVAAMGAVMGGLGYAMGGGFDKTSDPDNSAASRQKKQGSGTVLGDSEAKSSSLLNALEAMESNTFSQLKYSSGMLDALKSIQRSMAGLAQIIFRTAGLTSGNTFGIEEGTFKPKNSNPLLDAVGAPKLEDVFFGKKTIKISDSGLGINGALGDLTQGRGFSQYADVEETKSSFWGLVKRTSSSTRTRALDQDAADQLGAVFAGISSSLQIATGTFGLDAASIGQQLAASVISIPAVSLRGLKGAELQEALNAVFSGAADKLARTVAPGFEALQKAGEGYFETVIRASNALATANGWMQRLGKTLFGVSTSGAIASTKLADLFGGINEFNAAVGSFYGNYFSEAERAEQSTKEMAQALGTVNLALPANKDALKALVSTLDLGSESGRKAFTVLMGVQQEFSDTAELIARAAKDTGDRLLKAFTTDSIDFAGLRTALAGQTTEVFVSVLGSVFDQLAGRMKGTIDGIANERNAVRDAMLQINQPGMRTRNAIAGDIAGSQIDRPGNARVTGALSALRSAETGQKTLQGAVEKFSRGVAYWTEKENTGGPSEQTSLNIGWYTQGLKLWGTYLASANAYLGAAVTEARSAQLAYADALQNFAIDASKSLTRLGKLREETMRYYAAQQQLADLMGNSAKGLRETVRATRIGQLSDEDKFAQLKSDYAKNYSMGLSTEGATLAGYGDKLSAGLAPLLEAAKNSLDIDGYAGFAATALARADAIAGRLETLTPKDYAADSLALLGQIDATLAALDMSSKSAEKIISDAVRAGADQTAGGLRAVIAALTGQPVPAFALGGSFGGGLRIVGENGPELEATGPSRIYSASQTRSLLGGGGNTARLEALIERQAGQLAAVNAQLARLVASNADIAASTVRTEQDGQMIYSGAGTPVQTRAVA